MPKNCKPMPTVSFLREHLRYDPDTGILYRRSSGKLALISGHEYSVVSLKHVPYLAHRIIWKMEISEDVPDEIDHINQDKNDNRLENLREASASENQYNRLKYKNNTSGFKGVHWHKRIGKWQAQIRSNKKCIHLGYFDDPAEAHAAYVEAAKRLHGEFANDGHGPI